MLKVLLKVLCGALSAVFTLVTISIDDREKETQRVNLQCPSLIYASMSNRYSNTDVIPEDDDTDREAEEADSEKEADTMRFGNTDSFNLDDYTIKAAANYEEIADRVRGDEDDGEEDQESYDGKFVWVRENGTKIYSAPDASSKVIGQFKKSAKAIRISYSGEWSYIRFSGNRKGYILSRSLSAKKVNAPTPTPKPVKHNSTKSNTKKTTSNKSSGHKKSGGFGSFVRRFVGCRYVAGGSSPSGFDCSGFTMYCYRAYYGIKLPHGSNMQSSYGRKVSLSSMKVGDIIFVDHDHNGKADHVGIYVGGGQMVHASGVKYGVICVSVKNVKDILMVRRIR